MIIFVVLSVYLSVLFKGATFIHKCFHSTDNYRHSPAPTIFFYFQFAHLPIFKGTIKHIYIFLLNIYSLYILVSKIYYYFDKLLFKSIAHFLKRWSPNFLYLCMPLKVRIYSTYVNNCVQLNNSMTCYAKTHFHVCLLGWCYLNPFVMQLFGLKNQEMIIFYSILLLIVIFSKILNLSYLKI